MRIFGMLVVLTIVVILGACFPQAHVSLKNDCGDAWFRVSWLEGSGQLRLIENQLLPGDRAIIPLTGTSGVANKFVISVDGFRLGDDFPLGSASRDIWVYPHDGGPSAPQHNYDWSISQLYPGGCHWSHW